MVPKWQHHSKKHGVVWPRVMLALGVEFVFGNFRVYYNNVDIRTRHTTLVLDRDTLSELSLIACAKLRFGQRKHVGHCVAFNVCGLLCWMGVFVCCVPWTDFWMRVHRIRDPMKIVRNVWNHLLIHFESARTIYVTSHIHIIMSVRMVHENSVRCFVDISFGCFIQMYSHALAWARAGNRLGWHGMTGLQTIALKRAFTFGLSPSLSLWCASASSCRCAKCKRPLMPSAQHILARNAMHRKLASAE